MQSERSSCESISDLNVLDTLMNKTRLAHPLLCLFGINLGLVSDEKNQKVHAKLKPPVME